MPTITRQDMERVIVEERGSVLYGNRIITRVEDLPKEAELAGDDPRQRASVRSMLEARREALEAELAALDEQPQGAPRAEAPTAPNDLSTVKAVDDKTAEQLHAAGITTPAHLRARNDAALLEAGLSEARVKKIREELG